MKTNKLFLMGLLALGLTACTSDNDVENGGKAGNGNAYAGLTISLQAPSRALTDAQGDNVGRDAENGVNSIHMFSSLEPHTWNIKVANEAAADQGVHFWKQSDTEYRVKAFQTVAGPVNLALMLNSGSIGTNINNINVNTEAYGDASRAIEILNNSTKEAVDGDNTTGFLMTSTKIGKTINDEVSEADVNAQTTADDAKNVYEFTCERTVCQGVVSLGAAVPTLTQAPTASRVNVDLSSLTYSAMNGAAEFYVFGNHAGARTINAASKYNGFESALHSWKVSDPGNTDDWASAKDQSNLATAKLVRIGNLVVDPTGANVPCGITIDNAWMTANPTAAARKTARDDKNATLGAYAAIPVFSNAAVQATITNAPLVSSRGVYFFENTASHSSYKKENLDHGFWRLACAKVYGTVTPAHVYGLEYEQYDHDGDPATPNEIRATDNVKEYAIAADKATYDALPETTPEEKKIKAETYCPGTTFYRNLQDNYLYASAEAAQRGCGLDGVHHHKDKNVLDLTLVLGDADYATKGRPTAYPYVKYLDGRCGWRALWNRQTGSVTNGESDIHKGIEDASTRRNNIYLLEIASFEDLGFPFDSADPKDPNLPKPLLDNPKDPSTDTPDNPDVVRENTYMKVIAKILPWNVVKRQAVFY